MCESIQHFRRNITDTRVLKKSKHKRSAICNSEHYISFIQRSLLEKKRCIVISRGILTLENLRKKDARLLTWILLFRFAFHKSMVESNIDLSNNLTRNEDNKSIIVLKIARGDTKNRLHSSGNTASWWIVDSFINDRSVIPIFTSDLWNPTQITPWETTTSTMCLLILFY